MPPCTTSAPGSTDVSVEPPVLVVGSPDVSVVLAVIWPDSPVGAPVVMAGVVATSVVAACDVVGAIPPVVVVEGASVEPAEGDGSLPVGA